MSIDDWVRVTEWNGIVKGDAVKVRGERGNFTFLSHTTNGKGQSWVDVYGGSGGQAMFRAFSSDRIKKVAKKRQPKTM